jgi:hypothetical protein
MINNIIIWFLNLHNITNNKNFHLLGENNRNIIFRLSHNKNMNCKMLTIILEFQFQGTT